MRANLFINFYQDKNEDRQRELLICTLSNIYNTEIDTVNILIAKSDVDSLMKFIEKIEESYKSKITILPFEARPTYNEYFKFTEKYPNDINIIANKDVIIGVGSLGKLKKWNWKNYCLALCRWDFINDNLNKDEATFYDHADSQDVWILKGSFPQLKGVDFGLGIAGCDNAIAERLSHHFEVISPSKEIKTYHYHITQIRNYLNQNHIPIETVSKPYKLITPTMLP